MSSQDDNSHTLFPIRELCARTQVNSVTLRAWERRYGLLKPKRTDKGHRLYTESDVKRVEHIVEWIGRGVPVSRVKALLDSPPEAARSDAEVKQLIEGDGSGWQNAIDTLCAAVLDMSSAKTEHCLNEHFLNYPAVTCHEKLLQPVFDSLQTAPINLAAGAFLQSEIIRYVIPRTAAGKHTRGDTELQLICGDNTPIWRLALAALSLSDADIRVQLINQPCSVNVWMELVRAGHHRTHLVFQDGIWRNEENQRIRSLLSPTLWLCGAAPMTSELTACNEAQHPHFYPTPEQAVAAIMEQIKKRETT